MELQPWHAGVVPSRYFRVEVDRPAIPVVQVGKFDRPTHYAQLESSGGVEVTVRVNRPVEQVSVSPARLGVVAHDVRLQEDRSAGLERSRFVIRLPGAGHYVVMVDQMEYLFLFVSDPAATHLTDGAAVRTLADYDVYRVPGMAASVPAGAPAVTEALQAAIDDAATRADVAALRVPAGIYVTGPLCLPSGTRLHLDPGAVLLGSDRPDQWPSIDELTGVSRLAGRRAFVVVNGATDVAISGHGVIDANGVSMAAQGVASRLLLSYR